MAFTTIKTFNNFLWFFFFLNYYKTLYICKIMQPNWILDYKTITFFFVCVESLDVQISPNHSTIVNIIYFLLGQFSHHPLIEFNHSTCKNKANSKMVKSNIKGVIHETPRENIEELAFHT